VSGARSRSIQSPAWSSQPLCSRRTSQARLALSRSVPAVRAEVAVAPFGVVNGPLRGVRAAVPGVFDDFPDKGAWPGRPAEKVMPLGATAAVDAAGAVKL
jgi:hypothetical protein